MSFIVADKFSIPSKGVNCPISMKTVTMLSASKVCAIEASGPAILNPLDGTVNKIALPADGAVCNNSLDVVALKSGNKIQVYHNGQKKVIREAMLPTPPQFMTWLNDKIVGLVTKDAVYKWAMQGGGQPELIFNKNPKVMGGQVINFSMAPSGNFYALEVVKSEAGVIAGYIEFYNVQKSASQPFGGHAGTFAEISKDGTKVEVFAFFNKNAGELKIRCNGLSGVPFKYEEKVPTAPDAANDFPAVTRYLNNGSLFYAVTREGYLFVVDALTGSTLFRNKVGAKPLFTGGVNEEAQSFYAIEAASGRVVEAGVNGDALVDFVTTKLGKPELADSLAERFNVSRDPQEAINKYIATGAFDKILPFCDRANFHPNWVELLNQLLMLNPEGCSKLAVELVRHTPRLVEPSAVVDNFLRCQKTKEATSFLIDVLGSDDKKEDGYLQTKLLEIQLRSGAGQTADALLSNQIYSHFDTRLIAELCERAGLIHRALEMYTEMQDIKRCLLNAHAMKKEFLMSFFGSMDAEKMLECLEDMLHNNMQINLALVVDIAKAYADRIDPMKLIKLFESFQAYQGLFYCLGAIVNTSDVPDVHLKYAQAAAKMNNLPEVDRICKDSKVYNPEEMKDWLIEAKLSDPRPLINVCNIHGYVAEMTNYLYRNKQLKYIEIYVTSVAPENTPEVIGKLLDLDAEDTFILGLIRNVGIRCPIESLVAVFEERNRLRMLQPYLEMMVQSGSKEVALHNAIGKIYITQNIDPQNFLTHNQFYDSEEIGRFCERLDPYLAVLAYRRAWGPCDDLLIEMTNANNLFKDQARYLVEKQDGELWAKVLSETNEYRAQLIDDVVGTVLPECTNEQQVSTTVRAFISSELPQELINLLEKLVLQGGNFSQDRNLQNLLLHTAIKCHPDVEAPKRVMECIQQLDNFDGEKIARFALDANTGLEEEAFVIYTKFDMNNQCMDVLLNHIGDLERAQQFSLRVDTPECWSSLAKAQLNRVPMEPEYIVVAVDSYIKANDATEHMAVIDALAHCTDSEQFEAAVKYFNMARKQIKERKLDTELLYALARCNKVAELEEIVHSPNVADIQSVGERCYDEQCFNAAAILFRAIDNHSRLAACRVHLGEFREAVEAASRANSIKTWKEVCMACVLHKEFKLAQTAGLRIVANPDHLDEVVQNYEKLGHKEEIMNLLEEASISESAHHGIFTELGILYAKYASEKLMKHLKMSHKHMNLSKMIRACEETWHWSEAVFLYIQKQDVDQAVRIMMEHPLAFESDLFLESIVTVRNHELYYIAVNFYLEERPLELERLLRTLVKKIDATRVVNQLNQSDNLPLIMPYLKAVQSNNIMAVNEALNELYVDEEDFDSLRESINNNDNFNALSLAQKIEKLDLLEFRKIAAEIYRKNKRYSQSISLCKLNKLYKEAILTCKESDDADLTEELLRFFVDAHQQECFCATLYTCYSLIRPDVAVELAWRNGLVDLVMPFFVQYLCDMNRQIKELDERTKPKEKEEEAGVDNMFANMNGPLQIAATAFNPAEQQFQQADLSQQAMGMNQMNPMGGMAPMNQNMGMAPMGNPMGGMMPPNNMMM